MSHTINELQRLIHTLTSVEKKMFIMQSKISEGEKDYLSLYEIILEDKTNNISEIRKSFIRKRPNKSFQNNVSYLFNALIKTLVILRVGQDNWFNELYGLMTARLCIERSLPKYALRTLRDTKHKAFNKQNHVISYYAERMELSLLSDLDLLGVNESQLIEIQMNLKNTLNRIKHIQEQLSLLEVLKSRLLNQPSISNKIFQKETQDLILNEIALISGKNSNIFLSQKLHLMFQSFFFTHITDYKSALRIFYKLNLLFEENEHLWNFPPYDYLSVLDEILNTLGTMGHHNEMKFYLDKLQTLLRNEYPGHFIKEVQKSIHVYTLHLYICLKDFKNAKELVSTFIKPIYLHSYTTKESKLILWETSLYANLEDWQSVRKKATAFFIRNHDTDLERIGRLFSIIASYELNDLVNIEYDIRSYRRNYRSAPSLYEFEKAIFSIISRDIKLKGNAYKMQLQKEISNKIAQDHWKDSEGYQKTLVFYNFKTWLFKHCNS